jgi:transposase
MPRPCSRFIENLSENDREFLIKTWRTHPVHAVRLRSHAILLSAKGVSVPELTNIFSIDDDTARSWLERWEKRGRAGLEDEPRAGGPFKLDESERRKAIELLREHPNNPRLVLEQVKQQAGKSISRRTLNRWARAARLRWKRFGKTLKKLRDPQLFAEMKQELAELSELPDVKLAYFDEATFSLTAVVPYGWQKIGERRNIELSGARKNVHVFGIEEPNQVVSYIHRGSINGTTVANVLDDYAGHIRKTTALVLDNASPHTCKLIQDKKATWESKGLILIPLPAYSPELNNIERLWKDVKYSQLPIAAWSSLKALLSGLTCVFQRLGRTVLMPSIEAIA